MDSFLKISGDYTDWTLYKKAVIVCDVTEMFINRALPKGSRTIDQMRQAARSCKQNIVEGVSDATVSVEMCIKLLGVARGSLRELREDYNDFLRQHDMQIWPLGDPRTIAARKYCYNHFDAREFVAKCRERSDETVANIILTQIFQLEAVLAGTIKKAEAEFLRSGGLRETMSRARRDARGY